MADLKDMTSEELVQSVAVQAYIRGSSDLSNPSSHELEVRAEILRRMNDGWVSVEERLPEEHEPVLLAAGHKMRGVFIGVYHPTRGSIPCFQSCDSDEEIIPHVTHWRALPTPPKEDKQ